MLSKNIDALFGVSFKFETPFYQIPFHYISDKSQVMVTIIKKGTSTAEIQRKIEKALKVKNKKSIMDFAELLKSDIDPLEFQK